MAKGVRHDSTGRKLLTGEYERKGGGYEFKFVDFFGVRHSIYAKTLPKLRAKKKVIDRSEDCGRHTLDQAMEACFKVAQLQVSAKTLIGYSQTYDRYIAGILGKRDIKSLTPITIERFYLSLHSDLTLRVSTVESIHSVLHKILDFARKSRWISDNAADGCMRCLATARSREVSDKPEALSKDLCSSFIDSIVDDDMCDQAIIVIVMAVTGCRYGEAAGLRDVDVDYEQKTISIDHTISYGYLGDAVNSKRCGFMVTATKTAKSTRVLPVDDGLLSLLRRCAGRNRKRKRVGIDGYKGFLFIKADGTPYTNRNVNDYLKRAAKKYNIFEKGKAEEAGREALLIPENITCHIFRHTAATIMLESDVQLPDIMSILGHVDLDTTCQRYCHPSIEHKRDVIKCLSL